MASSSTTPRSSATRCASRSASTNRRLTGAGTWTSTPTRRSTRAGKKTGYGSFGLEFEIDSRDQLGDSVAIRPSSGPADTSRGARGWPVPVGFAKLEPSKWIALRFPASLLADDGILTFRISAWEGGDFGFYEDLVDSTHVRPPAAQALLTSNGARARGLLRRPR
jgi:hypothetical protein